MRRLFVALYTVVSSNPSRTRQPSLIQTIVGRLPRVPVGGLLEHPAAAEQPLLLERRRLQVQADGQPAAN